MIKLIAIALTTSYMVMSMPAYAKIGADIQITPSNTLVGGLSFDVSIENKEKMQATVTVTSIKSTTFPGINTSVELRDKDGAIGQIPFIGKIDGNRMIIYVILDRKLFDYSEVIVSTVGRYEMHNLSDPKLNGYIVAGRAYRIRLSEFIKK